MAGKKTFKNEIDTTRPTALNFISSAAEAESVATPDPGEASTQPARFTFRVPNHELKSRRLQLLLKPSTYEAIKAQADAVGASVNAYVNSLLEFYLGQSTSENYD